MDRTTVYIERDFLIRKIREIQAVHPYDGTERDQAAFETCEVIAGFAGSMPEGDVVPVRRARWVSRPGYYLVCSWCGMSAKETGKTAFCCACGARMNLKEE